MGKKVNKVNIFGDVIIFSMQDCSKKNFFKSFLIMKSFLKKLHISLTKVYAVNINYIVIFLKHLAANIPII